MSNPYVYHDNIDEKEKISLLSAINDVNPDVERAQVVIVVSFSYI